MLCDVITLLAKTTTVNAAGDVISITVSKDVFAEVSSISQSEFYQAQASGLKPEIKFILSDYRNYNNQKTLIYNSETYTVLRTYRKNNQLEITAYRGVN